MFGQFWFPYKTLWDHAYVDGATWLEVAHFTGVASAAFTGNAVEAMCCPLWIYFQSGSRELSNPKCYTTAWEPLHN
jgi:hypothetical protein